MAGFGVPTEARSNAHGFRSSFRNCLKPAIGPLNLDGLCDEFAVARFGSGPHDSGAWRMGVRVRAHNRVLFRPLWRPFARLRRTVLLTNRRSRRQCNPQCKSGNRCEAHTHAVVRAFFLPTADPTGSSPAEEQYSVLPNLRLADNLREPFMTGNPLKPNRLGPAA